MKHEHLYVEGWINENYLFLAYPLATILCVTSKQNKTTTTTTTKEIKGSAEQIVNCFLILCLPPYHFDTQSVMRNSIITIIKTFWPVNSRGSGVGNWWHSKNRKFNFIATCWQMMKWKTIEIILQFGDHNFHKILQPSGGHRMKMFFN